MTIAQIKETVQAFAEGARRAREAGLDGVELHGANGYLITQFLSSAINDRDDEYGGALENRARFVLEIVAGDSRRGGPRLPSADEDQRHRVQQRAARGIEPPGNTLEESIQVCQWLGEAGVDAIHVSTGSFFPHPKNPAGGSAGRRAGKTYDTHDLERRAHVLATTCSSADAAAAHLPAAMERCARAARARSRAATCPTRAPSSRRWQDAGHLHRRLPDRVGDRARDRARRLRRRQHRAAAHREQRSRRRCSRSGPDARRSRARTATSAWSTWSRTRSGATRSRFASHEEMVAQIMSVFHPQPYEAVAGV